MNKWAVAIAVALGAILELIDSSIVNVALTDMAASLGATIEQMSWVVTSYGIANVIILPLAAWLGHRFGKKRYFLFSLVGFTVASVMCGMSTSLPTLIVARVLQGLTGGGLMAKAQAILFETFPKEEQATAQGFFSAIVIAGPTIGPTLGGYIVTNIGWRWIFFVNLPLGVLAVMMVSMALPRDPPREARGSIDWTAIALLALGLGCLQTLLEEGNSEDWFDSRFIVAMTVVAAAGLTLFVARELRSKSPVVDLRVLRHRSLWAGSILSVVVGMALYGALFSVPLFAAQVMRFTSQQTGLLLLPGALVSALAMPFVARVVRRYPPRALIVVGALVLSVAVLWLSRLSPQTSQEDLTMPLMVRAFGQVLMFLPLSMATLGPIPRADIAAATGFYSLTRQLGGSIGIALLNTLLSHREAFHRSVLVEHLSATAPQVQAQLAATAAGLAAKGVAPLDAQQQALSLLDRSVNLQSAVMSFGDTFVMTAVLVLCTLPLVLLLGRPPQGAKVEVGH
ncbi:DHA2 family efflux MFS transporter permease subunit [Chondromyces apiculatus]|uniref:DHA2 family efflux MFS transporter permease subunit n=1 Tax=Chondromyces apiculatus TaxID=51 RepID=UPI0005C79612|nr:DHA2 family efflux MFS transporter permease subunit [Chondromyces apiculatus]